MSMVDLVASLKASLHDAAAVFVADGLEADAAFERFLLQALPDLRWKRPVTKLGTVTLTANFPRYSLGMYADFAAFKTHTFGENCRIKPWDPHFPGPVPRVSASFDQQQWWLDFERPPTERLISAHGSTFQFWYFAQHVIGANPSDTTVNEQDRGLLLLRAQVEAMRELSIRNAGKPVTLRDGLSGMPRNSTAAAIWKDLLAHFESARP